MFRKGDPKIFDVLRFILIVLLIVFVGTYVSFLFKPIVVFIQTVTFPVLIAGVLYYLLNPIMGLMESRLRLPRGVSIGIVFGVLVIVPGVLIYLLGPMVEKQVVDFTTNLPFIMYDLQQRLTELQADGKLQFVSGYLDPDAIMAYLNDHLKEIASNSGTYAVDVISRVTGVAVLVVVVPFILFYMLKDGHKIPDAVTKALKSSHQDEVKKILGEMNEQLRSYVQGQFIVALSVGVMLWIGYMSVGLEYALILAFVAFALNFVPFIGPLIGTFPALVVALIVSPALALKVLVIILVAQQIEGNFISPQVMGKKLDIHPLTIIILLLVAGKFGGLVTMILALPLYVVIRVVVVNAVRLWKLRNSSTT